MRPPGLWTWSALEHRYRRGDWIGVARVLLHAWWVGALVFLLPSWADLFCACQRWTGSALAHRFWRGNGIWVARVLLQAWWVSASLFLPPCWADWCAWRRLN